MIRLRPVMPFAADRNFGRACNETLAEMREDAWAVIMDHDAMWTTPHWHAQIVEAIACQPEGGAFAVVTNRIASPWQRAKEADGVPDDILRHRAIGEARRARRTLLDISDTKGFGGVVTVVNRRAWAETPGYADGLFCVDHSLHFRLRDAGRKVWLIEGLYVYHLRASSSRRDVPQEPKWRDCPCRGPELQPTRRVTLP